LSARTGALRALPARSEEIERAGRRRQILRPRSDCVEMSEKNIRIDRPAAEAWAMDGSHKLAAADRSAELRLSAASCVMHVHYPLYEYRRVKYIHSAREPSLDGTRSQAELGREIQKKAPCNGLAKRLQSGGGGNRTRRLNVKGART